MKIMYIHGFGSSAESGTVKRLRELLPDAVVVADDVPLQPQDAIAMLHKMADRENPDIIIGTSMGGMYAEQLHGYDRILVNPAFQIADTMKEHGMMGNQTYFNRRRDGVQQFVVTNALVKDFRTINEQCFQHPDPEHVWGLFGDHDPVVHTRSLFLEHYPRAINFHGEHRLNEHTLINYIVPLIRRIDKAQRGISDPIILIDFSCLSDSHGNPASSMLKTYYQLIADYDVRILAPSPSRTDNKRNELGGGAHQRTSPRHRHLLQRHRHTHGRLPHNSQCNGRVYGLCRRVRKRRDEDVGRRGNLFLTPRGTMKKAYKKYVEA